MPNNWKEISLKDSLSNVVDNRGKSCPTADSGIPLIATNCIKENALYPVFERLRYVDKKTYDNWFRSHPLPNDILFVNKGSPGLVCLVPNPVPFCIAQDMVALRPNPNIFNWKYFFAAMRSPLIRNQIDALNVGTMIPHLKKTDFDKIKIPLPSKEEQELIGEIYFSLNDKIELNLQTNKTLEEMANALYKHWFVDFGPFQNGKFVDSEIGLIPEGWELKTLEHIADFKNGKGIKDEDKYENGKHIVLGSNGIVGRTDKVLFEEPVIATGRVGANYGAIHYSLLPCWISDNAITSQPIIKNNFWFLLRLLQNVNYNNFAVGSAQPLITQGAIKNILFAYPNQNILDTYYSKVNNLYLSINENKIESETIKQTRDYLLPKLICGEIKVKDAVKKVKEVL